MTRLNPAIFSSLNTTLKTQANSYTKAVAWAWNYTTINSITSTFLRAKRLLKFYLGLMSTILCFYHYRLFCISLGRLGSVHEILQSFCLTSYFAASRTMPLILHILCIFCLPLRWASPRLGSKCPPGRPHHRN